MSLAQALKTKFQAELGLLNADELAPARGLATGWSALDNFVASGGFPCGEISVLQAREGYGATTLWLDAAAKVTTSGRRAAWMNGDSVLNPVAASQRGVDLANLFVIQTPMIQDSLERSQKRLWILQELQSSRLFDFIGCDLGDAHLPLREARALLAQVRRSGTAVIFLTRGERAQKHAQACEFASLVIRFTHDQIEVTRATRRPIPHPLQRRTRHVESLACPLEPSTLLASHDSSPSETHNALPGALAALPPQRG